MKFLTNVLKKEHHLKIYELELFSYKIKIFGKYSMKNIVKCSKLYAKQHGYKNPKISIHDTAISNTGEDISNSCWAVYVEEKNVNKHL